MLRAIIAVSEHRVNGCKANELNKLCSPTGLIFGIQNDNNDILGLLMLSQTTNFRIFPTESVCR